MNQEITTYGQTFQYEDTIHTVLGFSNSHGEDYLYTYYDDDGLLFPCRFIDVAGSWVFKDMSNELTILDLVVRNFNGGK